MVGFIIGAIFGFIGGMAFGGSLGWAIAGAILGGLFGRATQSKEEAELEHKETVEYLLRDIKEKK